MPRDRHLMDEQEQKEHCILCKQKSEDMRVVRRTRQEEVISWALERQAIAGCGSDDRKFRAEGINQGTKESRDW